MQNKNLCGSDIRISIAKAVTVFVLAYGLHYFAYFLRARYFNWLNGLGLDEGIVHALMYLGHTIFLIVMLLYALVIIDDRKYILSFTKGDRRRNLRFALAGAMTGFVMMAVCVFSAAINGDLSIRLSTGTHFPVFLLAIFTVLVQASVEEIESRGFVFGKMYGEGVPLCAAIAVSSIYFSYLHAANPGFGLLPLLSIFVVGVLYALSYYFFGTLWFTCTAHMMWNFTQDFIFGLPDSGKPAAVSIFNSVISGSGFFYDEKFGIEGSWMAILVNLAACVIVVAVGLRMRRRQFSML